MTRREVERLAGAVHDLEVEARREKKEGVTPALVSLVIGRVALPKASTEAWRKWLRATGWPEMLIKKMAEREAGL
jgi:hypothetical protein